jgi:hypothetical protein
LSTWNNTYTIAGFNLEIISTAGDPTSFLPPRMQDFTSSGPADLTTDFTIALEYDDTAQADPLKRFFPSKFKLSRREERLAFICVNGRERILGWISSQRDRGEMGLPRLEGPWRIEQEGEVVGEAIQALIGACLQCRLLACGGTLLHAAGITLKKQGYAFVGHTQAGKTTLVKDFPKKAILGDDLVAVRKIDEEPLLFGTPWPGREGGTVAPGSAPLKAIFNLHRELPPGLEEMTPPQAVAELSANAPRLGYEGEEGELLAAFSRMAQGIPIYKLSIKLGDDVMSWLKDFSAKGGMRLSTESS